MKEHIFILLLIITATEHLSAMTWGNYLYNWIPSRQTAMQRASQLASSVSNLMRPQLDPQLIYQLPAQWANLTPAQQNMLQYIALFGFGSPARAYGEMQQQLRKKEEALAHRKNETTSQRAYRILSQLSTLTRPQLNTQIIKQLPAQWENLNPRQKSILLYIALFGVGGPGIAYWEQRQRFKEEQMEQDRLYMQRQAEIDTIIKKIPASLKEIDAKLNSPEKMTDADLDSLKEQLAKNLEDLHNIKDEIIEADYNATTGTIDILMKRINSRAKIPSQHNCPAYKNVSN